MKLFEKYEKEDLSSFTMREIKYARARLNVLDTFVNLLQKNKYEDIRIKDISRKSEISEPSFYNYFPKKDDLFLYYIGLWSLDVQLQTRELKPGLAVIYEIFNYTALKSAKNPNLLKEIISYQSRTNVALAAKDIPPLTLTEKSIVFGAVADIGSYPDQGIGPVLKVNLEAAIRQKEIPSNDSIEILMLTLASVFFGLPVIIIHENPLRLPEYYKKVLQTILPLPK